MKSFVTLLSLVSILSTGVAEAKGFHCRSKSMAGIRANTNPAIAKTTNTSSSASGRR
ncbi:MAG: hypothetical protein N2578_00350 [Bdellovibrionaceae bacterium]|nr:hypothetical protein [Pseudobdellovibrionaceae bacterium]